MAENSSNYERYEDIDAEFEQSANSAPWADIPRNSNLPLMLYHFKCIDVYPSTTRINDDGSGGKGKIAIALQVLAPSDYAERIHMENFTIGTDIDKKAKDPRTWLSGTSFGATNLVKLIDFVGGKDWRDVLNKEFLAFVTQNGEYVNVNFRKLYHKGELAPGTPSPAQRGRLRDSGLPRSPDHFAPTSTEGLCPSCQQMIPNAEILLHIRHCRGVAEQQDKDEIPF